MNLNGCGNPARGSRSSADPIDLTKSILREIVKAECATAAGRTLHLRVAIDFSSREAIGRSADAPIALLNEGLGSFDSLGTLIRKGFAA